MSKGLVTVNTDASFHSGFKVGAYAFYIACDEGRFSHSGCLKKVKDPTEAEIQSIINAITFLKRMNIKGIVKIVINTDSMNAIHIFTNNKDAIKRYNLKYLLQYQSIIKKIGVFVFDFRHIKSHVDTKTKRAWVNQWCDDNAKKQLWNHINSNKKNE